MLDSTDSEKETWAYNILLHLSDDSKVFLRSLVDIIINEKQNADTILRNVPSVPEYDCASMSSTGDVSKPTCESFQVY